MEDRLIMLLPIIAVFMLFSVLIVAIIMKGVTKAAETSATSKRSFNELISELREENVYLKSELHTMKETLNSIHKMMKEVE